MVDGALAGNLDEDLKRERHATARPAAAACRWVREVSPRMGGRFPAGARRFAAACKERRAYADDGSGDQGKV